MSEMASTVFGCSPKDMLCWRPSCNSLVHHRCPLWSPGIGLVASQVIAVDLLHTYYLAPCLAGRTKRFGILIDSGLWAARGTSQHERRLESLQALQLEMKAFYRRHRAGSPTEELTEVSALTAKMIGIGSDTKGFKLKAMEAWGVSLWLLDLLHQHKGAEQLQDSSPDQLHMAGALLVEFMRRLKSFGYRLSDAQVEQLLGVYRKCMELASFLDLMTPKAHLLFHLILRSRFQRNPSKYHTFVDESLNKTLKSVLRLCHQINFERGGMLKLAHALNRPSVRRRLV